MPSSQPGARSLLAGLSLAGAKACVNTMRETWCLLAGMLPNNALDSFTVLASATGKGIDLSLLPSARQLLSRCPQIVLSRLSSPCLEPGLLWALATLPGPCLSRRSKAGRAVPPPPLPSRDAQSHRRPSSQEPPGTAILEIEEVWNLGTVPHKDGTKVSSGGSHFWMQQDEQDSGLWTKTGKIFLAGEVLCLQLRQLSSSLTYVCFDPFALDVLDQVLAGNISGCIACF